ncbi:MAG: DUF5110 domain-containing protein, partial [Bacteroidota bacterium]
LVCPVQEPNAQGRRMYFPKGKWYNFWTDEVVDGGVEKWVAAGLDTIPLFVKEGALIPKYPVQQYVGEKDIELLDVDVYYKEGIERSSVYEDQQDGYDYKKGRYSLRKFRLRGKENELIIQQFKDGNFITSYEKIKMTFHGLPFKIGTIELDNEIVDLGEVKLNGDSSIEVSKDFTELHIFGE